MSALIFEGTEVLLSIESNGLHFVRVEREQNTLRIVFQRRCEAEEVESTLFAAGQLQRSAVLPPFVASRDK